MGGEVREDYSFDAPDDRKVRISELFRDGKDTLIIYSFMFAPSMEQPCPL